MAQTFEVIVKEKQENGTWKETAGFDCGYSLERAMDEFFMQISTYKNVREWSQPQKITIKDSYGDIFANFQIN